MPSDPTAEHVGSMVPRECLLKAIPRALCRVPGLGNGTVSPALGNSLAVTASAPFTQAQGGDGSVSKHVSWGTSSSVGILLEMALGWLLRREKY